MTARRVWHFADLLSWKDDVLELLQPHVDKAVLEEFGRNPPEYIVGDDLTWLDDIVERVTGADVDMQEHLTQRLPSRYDAIRGFHGCRPVDVATYYEKGLLVMDPHRVEQQARDFFLSGAFPRISAADVEKGIANVGRSMREGRVYFEATQSSLEDHCAHYMLYGSEFVTGVAAGLRDLHGRDYRQDLKTIGRPTVLVCDVPLLWLPRRFLYEYAGMAVEAVFSSLLDAAYLHPPPGRTSGLMLKQALPPEFIVEHYHPIRLRDPLLGRRWVDC